MVVDSVPYPELSQAPAIYTKICAKLLESTERHENYS
jgi:hypothetical protein